MGCSRCGREAYPLYSVHTKASLVTHDLGDREWVCEACLTPREHLFLVTLPRLRSAKPRVKTVPEPDYKEALELIETFECPGDLGMDPADCDDLGCERQFDECRRVREALGLVEGIRDGRLRLSLARQGSRIRYRYRG
jgi:hypothetical protein